MRKWFAVLNVFGLVCMLFALTMLLPLAITFHGDWPTDAFALSLAITFATGFGLWLVSVRLKAAELKARDGFLLVVILWTGLAAFAALPLLLSIPGLSFTDAYFEAVSGLTTTGSTVLAGLDGLPPAVNVWRAQLHWFGGLGIIVFAVAILPLLNVGGLQVYRAETPGPMKDTKLTPRITETAKGLWLVYLSLTLACLLVLKLAGMGWIDALVHAFSALSTGGFSSHDASIGYFDSPVIEAVLVVFMLLGGVNFVSQFQAVRQHSPRPLWSDPELRLYLGVVLGSGLLLSAYLWYHAVYPDPFTTLRHAMFNTVSLATTTGFVTVDYALWPFFAPLWMLLLGGFSTCSGSTGGGMKMVRARLLFSQGRREILRLVHPQVIATVRLGGQPVRNEVVYSVLAFFFLYVSSWVFLTLVMVFTGLDFMTAFSAVFASLNTTGPGFGLVGPSTTYAVLSDFQTWVCTFAMLLGRLELFTFLVLFSFTFWRK